MQKNQSTDLVYSIGDSIVHTRYGVGEIVDVEDKQLFGKTDTYYVVQTKDSTFWLPVNKADNERTRPLVPPQTIKNKVIETLQDDPQEMASNYQTRRKRIKEVNASGKIVLVAQLVRDLTFRKAKKGSLATLDEKDLEYLKNRLITEWARSVGKTRENVAQKVENLLQLHRS